MEIFWLIVRTLLLAFAFLVVLLYCAGQLWQRVPPLKFQFKVHDYLVFFIVSLSVALGVQQGWGLFAFFPLGIFKFFAHRMITKSRVHGSGRWMEVSWKRFPMKGFQLPPDAARYMQQLPGDTHVLVPRLYTNLFLKYMARQLHKKSGNLPNVQAGQEAMAMDMFKNFTTKLNRLPSGQTEKLSLPFGELKVTRL